MKQIENVSISGISFMLDEQGYRILTDYLDRLGEIYRGNPDGGEIIADIEARLAELILAGQPSGTLVTSETVRLITERTGLPEEAAEEAAPDPGRTFPRRLYRAVERRRIGGVCGGIAAYLNIDPVWVRLAVFAPLLLLIVTGPMDLELFHSMMGVLIAAVVVVYFLLWFTVPAARTPRQRLEMRGERITASSIESSFRRDAPLDARSQRSAGVWAEAVWVFGRIVLFAVKAVAMVAVVALSVTGAAIATLLVSVLLGAESAIALVEHFPHMSMVSPAVFIVFASLVALIPVAMLVTLLVGLLFDRRIGGSVFGVTGAVWLLLVVFLCVVAMRNGRELIDGTRHVEHRIEISGTRVRHSHSSRDEGARMPVDTLPPVTVEVVE